MIIKKEKNKWRERKRKKMILAKERKIVATIKPNKA